MPFKKCVLIFGRSLNLAGISACLKLEEGLDVYEIDPRDPGARQRLEALTHDVILFDLSDPRNDLDMTVLHSKPGLLLIGMDPSRDDVLILMGKRSRAVTLNELANLVAAH